MPPRTDGNSGSDFQEEINRLFQSDNRDDDDDEDDEDDDS